MCLYKPARHALYAPLDDLQPQLLSGDFITRIVERLSTLTGFADSQFAEQAMNWLYTVCWLLGRLPKIVDFTDVLAMCDYVSRIHFRRPIGRLVMDFILDIPGLEAQSLDWTVMKDLLSGYQSLKTHPAVIKFTKVIVLAFSSGILETLGVEAKVADLWQIATEAMSKMLAHTDFLAAICDLLHFVGERIAAFCATGSWKSLLHTPTSYQKWVDEAHEVLDKSAGLANPEALGFDYHTYVSQLVELIRAGDEIKRFVRAADARDGISHVLSRLRVLHNEILITQACGKFRMAPFSMLLAAGTGVGKSSFMTTLISHYAKLYNKPLGDRYVYFRTPGEKHWNGFTTTCWATCIDDVAFINPNTGSEDPSLTDILLGVGNSSFSPPQASLEDKGKTPFMCDLFLCSTNTEDLKAHCWFNNPQAVRRRFPYIVSLVPKVEFRKEGTDMLDPAKVDILPGEYPDLWDITVKEVRVTREQRVDTVVILQTSSIYEFIANYNVWIDTHRRAQTAFMSSKKTTEDVVLCSLHRIPFAGCGCESASSSIVRLVPQGDEAPLKKQVSFEDIAIGGAIAWGTYKTACFVANNAVEVINQDPTIVDQPSRLVYHVSKRTLAKCEWYIAEKKRQIKTFTREQLSKVLRTALYEVYDSIKPNLKRMLIVLGALGTLGITWYYLKKEVPELFPQVSIDEVGVTPPKREEKENVWRKDDYQPSEFLGRLSSSWAALPLSKVASVVGRNTVWCQTTSGTQSCSFRALCLAGHLYVVPHHVLPVTDYFTMQVIHENNSEGCNGNVSFKMSQNMIYRLPNYELAFFEINHMPGRRDISGVLPRKGAKFDAPGRMIIRHADGSIEYTDTIRSTLMLDQDIPQFNLSTDLCNSYLTRDTQRGECGAPTVVQLPSAVVLAGIHVLGGERHQAVAVPIYWEYFEQARKRFRTPIVENATPFLEGQSFSTNVSPKCVTRYIEKGTVQVFGSFTAFKRQPKSTACDTLFTPVLVEDGRERKYGSAPMKGYLPLRLGILDMVSKPNRFKDDLLRLCTVSFAKKVIRGIPKEHLTDLKPLTLKCALNGYPGTRFIDSMNFSTSAGYPHNRSKRHFVLRTPADEIHQHPVVLTDEIKVEVEQIWNNMIQGISSAPVFMQHMKDEALPLPKVRKGKCRLFMGGPMAWSICVRMALLPFVRLMQLNKYVFECAPGTNATSIEWTRIYQYITKHGTDRMIAGDFRSFDKLMGSLVIMEAFLFIRMIYEAAGADDEMLKVIQVIAEDVAFAFVNFNGDLMRFFGSNPSGHPLTVIINCIVNSLYMRYCYGELNPKKEIESFSDNVSLITYGDDNIANSGVEWFNHTAIAEVLATVGIEYTMADKEAKSVPFIDVVEVTFLKRSFRYNEELDAQMAVLEEDSIWKSLMICVPSKEVSLQKQCIDIVSSAVSEWFFYGRERFECEVAYLRNIVVRSGLSVYVEPSTFPSWETLKERFIKASVDYLAEEPISTQRILGVTTWSPPI